MTGESSYSIGDPGRAALELRAGSLAARTGHADVELSAASLPGMLMIAATTRGLEHRATGTPRQDAFALSQRFRGAAVEAIAVVCDGVGGLNRSDEAAVLASCRLASLGADDVPWPEAFARANLDLTEAVKQLPACDGMATTAVAVSVRREAHEWVGEVAWIGDSSLWHLSPDEVWTEITCAPDEAAAYHSTDVVPMPSADGACSLQQFRVGEGAIFAMSDGVANPLRWSRDVQEALAAWWLRPPRPFTFAEQVSFARKSHVDDRTVIGIWPDGTG